MGVKIQNEFIYPFEGLFAVYLSYYLNDSFLVLDSNHPFPNLIISPISIIVEISQCISIIMEIFAPVATRNS